MTAQDKVEYHEKAKATAIFHLEEAKRKYENKVKHFNESIDTHENAIEQIKQEEMKNKSITSEWRGRKWKIDIYLGGKILRLVNSCKVV